MNRDEKSRSLGERSTHSAETARQLCGSAAMSVAYRLPESRNTDPRPTSGPSRLLSTALQNRLTQITRATDELGRCTDELKKPLCLSDRWGAFLGQADWLAELHNLLYEEQS
jgi:hypothetical protein